MKKKRSCPGVPLWSVRLISGGRSFFSRMSRINSIVSFCTTCISKLTRPDAALLYPHNPCPLDENVIAADGRAGANLAGVDQLSEQRHRIFDPARVPLPIVLTMPDAVQEQANAVANVPTVGRR